MKLKLFGTLLAALAAAVGFISCDNMDALYIQYLQEQNYSGKISNLQGQSGTGRVILTWTNPEDQISKKIKIVYGDEMDRHEKVFETLVDEASIDGLTSSAYEFTVYTMDAYDNLSVPVSISKTLYTQSHINSMEPPRCLLTKVVTPAAANKDENKEAEGDEESVPAEESYTYTLTFAGLCNSMMMFGGELEYTIRDTDGSYIHSDSYSVTIAANALKSSYITKAFKGLELTDGHTYEIEYSLKVYPANLASVGTDGSYSYTAKSIDLTTMTKTVTVAL